MTLDLPLIWAILIATAVFLYVVLDGFDLGIGILFPFAKDARERDAMMNTVAPVWDGNETWLVLGGGGLFAAFPLAYATVMPALYLPIGFMLTALIFRGVAFEFRARGRGAGRRFWSAAFAAGSLVATLAQGFVLGGFVQGIKVENGAFAGGSFDWLTPYTLLVAVGLVAGYALLGAAWLLIKTEGPLHDRARRWAWWALAAVAVVLAAVSLATLVALPGVAQRWGFAAGTIDLARLLPRAIVPAIGAAGVALAAWGLARGRAHAPFLGAVLLFLSGYAGLAVGLFPYVTPYTLTFRDAAAADNALGLMLVGVAVLLPVILAYTAYVYWVFRGKVGADAGYH
ncbi:MAG: cytochrome d ubiquinol oxidase subunit II [Pseudomonadota bacterium]